MGHRFRRVASIVGVVVMGACAQVASHDGADPRVGAEPLVLPAPKTGRERPLVVIFADNSGTETTDFVVPYGVLKESGIADVVTVSTEAAVVELHPALRIRADRSLAEFDDEWADGADLVIVPALHRTEHPEVLAWLRRQAGSGAVIVGICDGVRTVAAAGLLDGRVATGHWFSLNSLARTYRDTTWVRDRRYVADGPVMTTAGVTASVPASLAIVEAIGGAKAAAATADRLSIPRHDPVHDSDAFGFSAREFLVAAANLARFWQRDDVVIPVDDGVDEIALALTADAWSRTFRSAAAAANWEARSVHSKRGLVIETDRDSRGSQRPVTLQLETAGRALDASLSAIGHRYGRTTARLVASQLEYPWGE